ncbi:hypothetical protein HGG78_13060 [Vibrio aestuarianus]|uniref:hypothetical protein n=1 Tax=Vibrio aestuarianus TaxID=28171 RepID=UPI001559EEAB|nr:hypothetical protein [Vibrio aestuarianus]NGZ14663.1 hypothetical protein [Vibrio aestuarianus]NKZ50811.1 hypothetical protein [Vibrio aestuarianus]
MKKTLISLFLMSLAANVSAQTPEVLDVQNVDQTMSQLMVVEQEGEFFVTIDEEASFEEITFSGFVVERYSEIYISRHDANALQLEQKKKFYVYGEKDLEALNQKIALRIDQDNPTFFSVDLYRDYHGDSGDFSYVARVMEY